VARHDCVSRKGLARGLRPQPVTNIARLDVLVIHLRVKGNANGMRGVVARLAEERDEAEPTLSTNNGSVLILVDARKLRGEVKHAGRTDVMSMTGIIAEMNHAGLEYLILVSVQPRINGAKVLRRWSHDAPVILEQVETRVVVRVMLNKNILANNRVQGLVMELSTDVKEEGADLVSDTAVLGSSLGKIVDGGIVIGAVERVSVHVGIDRGGDVELGFGLLMQHTLDTSSEGRALGIRLLRTVAAVLRRVPLLRRTYRHFASPTYTWFRHPPL